jgi:hypothetical protein
MGLEYLAVGLEYLAVGLEYLGVGLEYGERVLEHLGEGFFRTEVSQLTSCPWSRYRGLNVD